MSWCGRAEHPARVRVRRLRPETSRANGRLRDRRTKVAAHCGVILRKDRWLFAVYLDARPQVIELRLQTDFVALAHGQFFLETSDKEFKATDPRLEFQRLRAIRGQIAKQSYGRRLTLNHRVCRVGQEL